MKCLNANMAVQRPRMEDLGGETMVQKGVHTIMKLYGGITDVLLWPPAGVRQSHSDVHVLIPSTSDSSVVPSLCSSRACFSARPPQPKAGSEAFGVRCPKAGGLRGGQCCLGPGRLSQHRRCRPAGRAVVHGAPGDRDRLPVESPRTPGDMHSRVGLGRAELIRVALLARIWRAR